MRAVRAGSQRPGALTLFTVNLAGDGEGGFKPGTGGGRGGKSGESLEQVLCHTPCLAAMLTSQQEDWEGGAGKTPPCVLPSFPYLLSYAGALNPMVENRPSGPLNAYESCWHWGLKRKGERGAA